MFSNRSNHTLIMVLMASSCAFFVVVDDVVADDVVGRSAASAARGLANTSPAVVVVNKSISPIATRRPPSALRLIGCLADDVRRDDNGSPPIPNEWINDVLTRAVTATAATRATAGRQPQQPASFMLLLADVRCLACLVDSKTFFGFCFASNHQCGRARQATSEDQKLWIAKNKQITIATAYVIYLVLFCVLTSSS
jgi:hypothetical protein